MIFSEAGSPMQTCRNHFRLRDYQEPVSSRQSTALIIYTSVSSG